MKLEWMGRYRELVRALIYYSNTSNRGSIIKTMPPVDGIALSKHEYQILEYICEFENENKIMTDISKDLGILQSIVTKASKNLLSNGLIERYRISGNKKNIVLKPTEKGRNTYIQYYTRDIQKVFTAFFNSLEGFSDEQIEQLERSIRTLGSSWGELSEELLERID